MSNVKISAKPASSATYDGTEFLAGIQAAADAKFAANQIYAAATKAATAKSVPVAGDLLGIVDSAASFGLKSVSWAAIQQYFTSLFGAGGSATAPTDFKDSVACATTANIALTGEQTIDGVLTSASRVLVKDQTVGSQNGIYVSAAGAWSRSTDADTSPEVTSGMLVEVEGGTVSGSLIYVLVTNNPITLATTALVFQAILLPFNFFVYKPVAGTTYTHILLDSGKRLNFTNAAAKTFTVAPQSSVASAVNTEIEVRNAGAGLLTIAPGAAVTLTGPLLIPQYSVAKLKKAANPNTWDISLSERNTATVTVAYGATITLDFSTGINFITTLTGNVTFANPSNAVDGEQYFYRIKQDGTGSRVATWGNKYKFAGGAATSGVLSTTASAIDVLAMQYNAADDTFICVLNKAFS